MGAANDEPLFVLPSNSPHGLSDRMTVRAVGDGEERFIGSTCEGLHSLSVSASNQKGEIKVENTLETGVEQNLDLSLDDLQISEVAIEALTTEDSVGIPDLGASLSYYSCTFC